MPHALSIMLFVAVGAVLAVTGMETMEIFTLLLGCGGIGAGVVVAASGGRRLALLLAHGIINAGQ